MSEENDGKGQRMAGTALRVAARLMETRGSGAILFKIATEQLGINALHLFDVPTEVVPHRPLHLGVYSSEGEE